MEEEDGGTGAEEVVSFIDLPPNNLTKLPEKGILKKHGGYGIVMPDSCNTTRVGAIIHEYSVKGSGRKFELRHTEKFSKN